MSLKRSKATDQLTASKTYEVLCIEKNIAVNDQWSYSCRDLQMEQCFNWKIKLVKKNSELKLISKKIVILYKYQKPNTKRVHLEDTTNKEFYICHFPFNA